MAGARIRPRANPHLDKRFYQGARETRFEFGINSWTIKTAWGRIGGPSRGLRDQPDGETAGHRLVRYGRFPCILLDLIPNSFSEYIDTLFPGVLRCGFPTVRIRGPESACRTVGTRDRRPRVLREEPMTQNGPFGTLKAFTDPL